jgi:hypothetical protein
MVHLAGHQRKILPALGSLLYDAEGKAAVIVVSYHPPHSHALHHERQQHRNLKFLRAHMFTCSSHLFLDVARVFEAWG